MGADRRTLLALTLASTVSMSCAQRLVIRGTESAMRARTVRRSPDRVFGETVRVTMRPLRLYGELIACDEEALYLRVHEVSDSAWRRIEWSERPIVDMALPSTGPAMLAWSILGTVSTISHGFYAIISANVWAAAGTVATAMSWSPRMGLDACDRARPFARFPQGLPASFAGRFGGVFDESLIEARTPWTSPPSTLAPTAPWATPPSPPATP